MLDAYDFQNECLAVPLVQWEMLQRHCICMPSLIMSSQACIFLFSWFCAFCAFTADGNEGNQPVACSNELLHDQPEPKLGLREQLCDNGWQVEILSRAVAQFHRPWFLHGTYSNLISGILFGRWFN